jgi:drug/metabolite transporter (DMT)-like permease
MIWGGSFVFMRVLAPVLGPILTSNLRILLAGIILIIYFKIISLDVEWKKNFKHYLILGLLHCSIPFSLFSFAALHLPASNMSILNACTPFFAAIFSALWLNEPLKTNRVIGLILGFTGVVIISKAAVIEQDSMFIIATLACILATVCYGLSVTYIKTHAHGVNPVAIAGAGSLLGGLAMLPANYFNGEVGAITLEIVVMVFVFALFCSAIAFILFYKLIKDIGPTKATTVTFLIPVFGMLWGNLILDEQITSGVFLGCAVILLGIYLIFRNPKTKQPSSI